MSARPSLPALLALALAVAVALPTAAQQLQALPDAGASCAVMPRPVVTALVVAVLVSAVLVLKRIATQLTASSWSLANALSEVTELRVPVDPAWTDSQGDLQARLAERQEEATARGLDATGPATGPTVIKVLEPSSSRLIALVGMVVILLMYLGFGLVALYDFGLTCRMPESTGSVTSFLYSGMALFAPYVANKVSKIFQPLMPSAKAAALPAPIARRPQPEPGRPPAGPAPMPTAAPQPPAPSEPQEPARMSAPAPAPTPAAATAPAPAHAVLLREPLPAATAAVAPAATAAVAPAAAAAAPPAYQAAVSMIAAFEGFRAEAYPDPLSGGEPWTIGYGFTRWQGRPVQPGQTISRDQADAELANGVQACAAHLAGTIPYWAQMGDDQRCALIDFAWNLGQDFYGDEADFATISRDLRERDWNAVPEALCLYCNPGTAVEAGLRRRRQAEADLWRRGLSGTAPAPAHPAPAAPAPVAPATPATPAAHPNPLPVPWFDQLCMDDGQGWRDCFSASSAMLAAYWGKEPNEDTYNRLRERFGDTTSSEAQLEALRSLGLDAHFGTDGTFDLLRREIDAGRPVAVGWLHHGPPSAPSGGGHWTVVIGYDATGVFMNDPYGSCDLVDGGYPQNHNGADQHYSFRNWGPRWRVDGSGGWYLTCRGPTAPSPR